jgi:DNA-binding response OmpR family regulator
MIRESNLLLVEDDMAVRQSLTRVLTTENYKVFGASTCQEAVQLCSQNEIDVVLLDLNLDPEDGWEVFQQLRELRPDLPIFVTSGQPQRFAHSSAPCANGILEKPLDLPVLVGLLNHATRPGPLLRIPSQRKVSRAAVPTPVKRPVLEIGTGNSSEAQTLKLLIPPYWLFVYPWRAFLYTFRAIFHR